MLAKPEIPDEEIVTCLLANYDLIVDQIVFLPLGADHQTAVYRVVADDETPYFLKLRQRGFNELSVALPRFLALPKFPGDQGIEQIIVPLPTTTGQLQATMGDFGLVLYPFVEGRDGYEAKLSAGQWRDLGAALKRIHAAELPPALRKHIGREAYSPQWREAVLRHLARAEVDSFVDPLEQKTAAFLIDKRDEIIYLVERAERLAKTFRARTPEFVLCHADIHAGNLLLANDGACYIVDWDEAILAPKERDLMFVGGSLMGGWYSAEEEEALFYPAYGQTEIDPFGLAYYRYERIIEDIAVICEGIFATIDAAAGQSLSVADREQSFRWLTSNFLPDHTIEMAYRVDPVGADH